MARPSLVELDVAALNLGLLEQRSTANSYRIVARSYPNDMELTGMKLDSGESLRQGGGAGRKNAERSEMDAMTLRKSVFRSATAVRRLCLRLEADRMMTLTFRENVTDYDVALKVFAYFGQLMRKRFPNWEYVAVPELQKRGAYHFHLAIRGFYDVNAVRVCWRKAAGELQGTIHISTPKFGVRSTARSSWIAGYIAKYLAKGAAAEYEKAGLSATAFNRRRYFASRGIAPALKRVLWLPFSGGGFDLPYIFRKLIRSLYRKGPRLEKSFETAYSIFYVST